MLGRKIIAGAQIKNYLLSILLLIGLLVAYFFQTYVVSSSAIHCTPHDVVREELGDAGHPWSNGTYSLFPYVPPGAAIQCFVPKPWYFNKTRIEVVLTRGAGFDTGEFKISINKGAAVYLPRLVDNHLVMTSLGTIPPTYQKYLQLDIEVINARFNFNDNRLYLDDVKLTPKLPEGIDFALVALAISLICATLLLGSLSKSFLLVGGCAILFLLNASWGMSPFTNIGLSNDSVAIYIPYGQRLIQLTNKIALFGFLAILFVGVYWLLQNHQGNYSRKNGLYAFLTLATALMVLWIAPCSVRKIFAGNVLQGVGALLIFKACARNLALNPPMTDVPIRTRIFVLLSVVLTALFSLVSLTVFFKGTIVDDNVAMLTHAKLIASGALRGTLESFPHKTFYQWLVVKDGLWWSIFPPGHLFALAFGQLWNIPWIINPLIGGITFSILAIYSCKNFSRSAAVLLVLGVTLSPFILFMNAEYMNHVTGAFGVVIVLFFLSQSRHLGYTLVRGIQMGMGIGVVGITRPLTSIGLALGVGALVLSRRKLVSLRFICGTAFSCLCFFLFYCVYNYLTSGSIFVTGYELQFGSLFGPGFGIRQWGYEHTLMKGIENFVIDVIAAHDGLWGGVVPAAFLLSLGIRYSDDKDAVIEICTLAVTCSVVYIAQWNHDMVLGPRHIYEGMILLIPIMMSGLVMLGRKIHLRSPTNAVVLIVVCVILITRVVEVSNEYRTYRYQNSGDERINSPHG